MFISEVSKMLGGPHWFLEGTVLPMALQTHKKSNVWGSRRCSPRMAKGGGIKGRI